MDNYFQGSYRPISPHLDENGVFVALQHFPQSDGCKPNDLTASKKKTTPIWWSGEGVLSRSMEASLGIPTLLSTSASANTVTFVSDALNGWLVEAEDTPDQLVQGTFWGVGLRLRISVLQVDASFDAKGPAQIAASVTLGGATASYELSCYGIDDPSLLSVLPGPGRFDQAAYSRWLEASAIISERLAAKPEAPLPLAVTLKSDGVHTFDPTARAYWLAMQHATQKLKGKEAVAAAQARGLSGSVVEDVYRNYFELHDNWTDTMDQGRQRKAQKWVEQTNP